MEEEEEKICKISIEGGGGGERGGGKIGNITIEGEGRG